MAERTAKWQKTGVLTIRSVYRPNAEAVLKVLAKLLSKGPQGAERSEWPNEAPAVHEDAPNDQ